jgi:WD40 repeat protein
MDKRVYLWNALTGDRVGTLEGHTGCVVGVAFNRFGDLLISSSWDGSTRFWNPATGEQLLSVPLDFARFIPFSADDRQICLLESDDLPSVWDVAPGRECRRWPAPSTFGATFCAGGRVLIGIAPDSVRFWDAADGHPLGSLPVGHCASVFLQPDGRSLWASGPSGLLRYSLEFDPLTAEVKLGPAQRLWESALGQASFSLDGQTLAAACPDRPDVLLLNLHDPAQPRFLQGHAGATYVALSPDARWLATGPWNGPSVKVWEVASGQPVRELPFEGPALVSFTPDGRQLITGNTIEYRVWATGSWECLVTVPRHNARSTAPAMALAPDGRTVALLLGREEETQLYALPSLRPLAAFDEGSPLCFSPDGAQFATFDNQAKRVLNWDLRQVREELAAMRLDWEAAPLVPRRTNGSPAKLRLTIASP